MYTSKFRGGLVGIFMVTIVVKCPLLDFNLLSGLKCV